MEEGEFSEAREDLAAYVPIVYLHRFAESRIIVDWKKIVRFPSPLSKLTSHSFIDEEVGLEEGGKQFCLWS